MRYLRAYLPIGVDSSDFSLKQAQMMIRTEDFFIALGHRIGHRPEYKGHHRGGSEDAKAIAPITVPISQQSGQSGTGRRSSAFGAYMTKRGGRNIHRTGANPVTMTGRVSSSNLSQSFLDIDEYITMMILSTCPVTTVRKEGE